MGSCRAGPRGRRRGPGRGRGDRARYAAGPRERARARRGGERRAAGSRHRRGGQRRVRPAGRPRPPARPAGARRRSHAGDGRRRRSRAPRAARCPARRCRGLRVRRDAGGGGRRRARGRIVARIPAAADGSATLRWAPDLHVMPFSELWEAIEQGDAERVRRVAEGKTVLFIIDPAPAAHVTPIGPLSRVAMQAELLNAVLTGAWLRSVPPAWAWTATAVLAALAAWLGLARRTSAAVLGVALLAGACVGALTLTPWLGGPVLPVVAPLAAMLAAGSGRAGVGPGRRRSPTARAGGRGRRHSRCAGAPGVDGRGAGGGPGGRARRRRALHRRRARPPAGGRGAARSARRGARPGGADARHLQALERELRAAAPGPAGLADAELERLRGQCAEVGIVTRDRGVLALFQDLRKAARAPLPILISGEPGTGKELFARAAHRLSARAAGPFVAVNMAAIAPELFESELFGHVRGSFTGAVGERKGYFEQAHGGTIFLDEIGELRAEHQGKLLRVLQERTFHRVGATRPTTVDVRVVAATNRDLERGVAEGWFREDLLFRLRGVVLTLPPLRERPDDVAPLAERFLREAAAEAGRPVSLSEAALRALEGHPWPGNVRELQQCLRRAVALADREVLDPGRPAAGAGGPAPGRRPTATGRCWHRCAGTGSTCRRPRARSAGTAAR